VPVGRFRSRWCYRWQVTFFASGSMDDEGSLQSMTHHAATARADK
jgi:hypothetical protein